MNLKAVLALVDAPEGADQACVVAWLLLNVEAALRVRVAQEIELARGLDSLSGWLLSLIVGVDWGDVSQGGVGGRDSAASAVVVATGRSGDSGSAGDDIAAIAVADLGLSLLIVRLGSLAVQWLLALPLGLRLSGLGTNSEDGKGRCDLGQHLENLINRSLAILFFVMV